MKDNVLYSEYFYNKGSKNAEVLEKTANENPCSSLASFLLLYHYKKNSHPDFEKFSKKAVLQFTNPLWLQFQLHGSTQKPDEPIKPLVENLSEETGSIEIQNIPGKEIDLKQKTTEEWNDLPKENNVQAGIIPETTEAITEHAEEVGFETLEPIIKIENMQETIPVLSKDIKEPATEESTTMIYEPLHTVDYFASQGIKITDELISNDKLGNQMKSFTEWLKSMKKLHYSKLPDQSVATERLVQSEAEASNVLSETLTEAMAEVLIKQDKKEKAIEMFSKLSLINPDKSAYFAAKIESLKSN